MTDAPPDDRECKRCGEPLSINEFTLCCFCAEEEADDEFMEEE